MHVCAEMPTKLVDDPLVLYELVICVTMSRLQKIDQLSRAVCFVDIGGTIHEDFFGLAKFGEDYGLTGEVIASAILDALPKWNLNVKNCRG